MSTAFAPAALAIASAVFNSLWEGALIAGAVWLGLRCLPKLGAATRYAIWLCALVALVLVPVLTAGVAEQPAAPAGDGAVLGAQTGSSATAFAPAHPAAARVAPEPAAVVSEPAPAPARKARITVSQSIAVAAALIWILVACARGLLLVLDVRALAAIRRNAWLWSAAHDYPVFLSDRVRVPLAAGFLRPAIILPASLVQRLQPEAVEAIVIHEVAHLRRYDVWTNALARIAEVFGALNPAAWFVMRRLAVEREIACDDWVVAQTGTGDAFAHALATLANGASFRMQLAAPSALGSRHSIVVRIERLLDAAPRRLRLSRPALGGALTLLALIALTVQSVSPVLAYEFPSDPLAQGPAPTVIAANCAVPDRGIVMSFLLGPKRRTLTTPRDDVELLPAQALTKRLGTSKVATFDLTVDASGTPRKVVVISPKSAGVADAVTHIYMASTYKPALRDCVPVTATIRTAIPLGKPEPHTVAVIAPVYPAGWSEQYKSSCKVPTVTHARYRAGFVAPTEYGKMVPAYPDSMNDVPDGSAFKTSVRVHVTAAGAATSAAVVSSSGRPAFDDAALAAARRATYPLIATTCKPLPTDYVWNDSFERTSMLFHLAKAAARPPTRR